MKRLAIITRNVRLYDKVRLLCQGSFEILRRTDSLSELSYDLCVIDRALGADEPSRSISISERFSLEELRRGLAALSSLESVSALTVMPSEGVAVFKGKKIKLTDTELRMLSVLLESDGFVERQALLDAVFADGAGDGSVNVYIHYLREKLEKDGDRVIISSRKYGYKIDEKWREKDA